MSETDEFLIKIRQAFKDSFDADPHLIAIDTTPGDIPAWDSIGHLSLAANLEQVFGITLDVDELMAMENVRAMVGVISANLARKV